MELHQIRYFVAVVECGGFRKAAEKCNVSQPSLSQQIIKLEKELELSLFDRMGRRVALTEAGRAFLPRARVILDEVTYLENSLAADLGEVGGSLRFGFIATLAPFLLARSVRALQELRPQARLEVVEGLTDFLVDELLNARLDLAFVSLPLNSDMLSFELLAQEPLVVALPDRHPLAQKKVLTLEDLDKQPFVALHQEHCLGGQVSDFCYGHQLYPNIVCRSHQLETVQQCVQMEVGLSLVPQMATQAPPAGVVYRPLEDEPPSRPVAVAWHRAREVSRLAQSAIEVVRELLANRLEL